MKKGTKQTEQERELLEKIEKQNKQTKKEVGKCADSNKNQNLINSYENKNNLLFKQLGDLEKKIDYKNSFKELLDGHVIEHIGATMPYTRYDTDKASLGGGASIVTSPDHDEYNIASQGSNQNYIKLPNSGAYAEWTMETTGRGVTMRFTLPYTDDGMGQKGSLDAYINNQKLKH